MNTRVRQSSLAATFELPAIPTTGVWERGSVVFNTQAGNVGTSTGWVCVQGGTPGTWESFGATFVQANSVYDPPALAAGATVIENVIVSGVSIGDFVEVAFSLDLAGVSLFGWVSAANTVSVLLRNNTASVVNLGSGSLHIRVNFR